MVKGRGKKPEEEARENIDKKELSEQDIRTKFITPALRNAKWDIRTQIREEVKLTDGRVIVKGNSSSRGKPKWADFCLTPFPRK